MPEKLWAGKTKLGLFGSLHGPLLPAEGEWARSSHCRSAV